MPEEFIDDIIAPDASSKEGTTLSDAVTPTEDQAPASTPTIEDLAAQLGWKANHNGENFVDAATYILRSKEIQSSMKDHNKDLKNQLQNLQGSVDALKDHNDRVYKTELTRMESEIVRLKKEKREAIETADVEKVDALEQEINSLEKNLSAPKPTGPSVNPIYDEWIKDNSWYLTNNDMATYADTVAQQYSGAPLERLYPLVQQKVAEVFPEYFQQADNTQSGTLANPGKFASKTKAVGPASPVESGHKAGMKNAFTKADLTSDQLSIMSQFVKSGIMTEDQYIKDIAKLQGA